MPRFLPLFRAPSPGHGTEGPRSSRTVGVESGSTTGSPGSSTGRATSRATSPTPGRARRRARRLLAAAGALALWPLAVPAGASPALGATGVPSLDEAAAAPLTVVLKSSEPLVLRDKGPLTVSGSVTNDSSETWESISVYALTSSEPVTTTTDLRMAAGTASDSVIGNRILAADSFDTIGDVAPGESRSFSLTVPRDELQIGPTPGVYWVGVQALGTNSKGRDDIADGRARTLVPLVEKPGTDPVAATLVVPIRARIDRDAHGHLLEVDRWAGLLGRGGRLNDLLDSVGSTDGVQVTWLVDPAVLEAVEQLAAGNPADLLMSASAPEPPVGTASPDATSAPAGTTAPEEGEVPEGTGEAVPLPLPGDEDLTHIQVDEETRTNAQRWLGRTLTALREGSVVALPYGDLDLSAAVAARSQAPRLARQRSEAVLERLDVDQTPAVSSTNGYLRPAAVAATGTGTTVLIGRSQATGTAATGADLDPASPDVDPGTELGSDLGSEPGSAPGRDQDSTSGSERSATQRQPVAGTSGSDLTLQSDLNAQVTPETPASTSLEPDQSFATAGQRTVTVYDRFEGADTTGGRDTTLLQQRILSEAALRRQGGSGSPMVFMLPDYWHPTSSSALTQGLDVPWIRWQSVTTSSATAPAEPLTLTYPAERAAEELPASLFTDAARTAALGRVLARVVDGPSPVGQRTERTVLSEISLQHRDLTTETFVLLDEHATYLQELLNKISVEAPQRVILSSDSGQFSATVSNDLPVPVRVRLDASTDADLNLDAADDLSIPASGRRTLRFQANSNQLGVHTVTLSLQDLEGAPTGVQAVFPVRAASVSQIVWWIMVGGGALLIVMITRRLLQRRTRRSMALAAAAEEAARHEADQLDRDRADRADRDGAEQAQPAAPHDTSGENR